MAICPNEHFHFLLHALQEQNRDWTLSCLADLLAWLVVPGNPLPKPRISLVTDDGLDMAESVLRGIVTQRRADMAREPSLARQIEQDAADLEQVADAMAGVRQLIDIVLIDHGTAALS